MSKTVVAINYKNYKSGVGKRGIGLARKIGLLSRKFKNYEFILCPGYLDLVCVKNVVRKYGVRVFAQHLDPIEPGKNTGFVSPYEIFSYHIDGVVLNHAEHKLRFDVLKKSVLFARKYRLKILLCADNLAEAKRLIGLKPDYLALEPPELIGGNKSLALVNPRIVERIYRSLNPKRTKILLGAGVKRREDLVVAKKAKLNGIFISSLVMNSKKPIKDLKKILD